MFLKNYGKKEVVSCPSIDDLLSRQLLPSFIYSNFMFISLQLSPSNITSLIPVDLAVNLFFTFSCTFGCIVQASDLFFFFFFLCSKLQYVKLHWFKCVYTSGISSTTHLLHVQRLCSSWSSLCNLNFKNNILPPSKICLNMAIQFILNINSMQYSALNWLNLFTWSFRNRESYSPYFLKVAHCAIYLTAPKWQNNNI